MFAKLVELDSIVGGLLGLVGGIVASLKANRSGIGSDFAVSTSVFDSTVDKIGVLPPQLVHEVVFLYRYFSELNGYPRAYADLLREHRGYEGDEGGSPNKAATERELKGSLVSSVRLSTGPSSESSWCNR